MTPSPAEEVEDSLIQSPHSVQLGLTRTLTGTLPDGGVWMKGNPGKPEGGKRRNLIAP